MPVESFKIPNDAVDLDAFLGNKSIPTNEKCPPEIFFHLNMNPSADGSAYLEYGHIKVCCSVNGPLEMRQEGQLVPGVKFAPFVRWLQYDQKIDMEKRLSQLLLSAIESSIMLKLRCPFSSSFSLHSRIGLILRHLAARAVVPTGGGSLDSSNVGDCLAAAVTCAGLALLNAGVQMYDVPVGVNVDLSAVTATSQGRLCATVLPKLHQFPMLFSNDTRIRDIADLRKALDRAMDSGAKLANTIRQCLIGQVETNVG
ncbi:exosome complex component MTR3 [Paragonimus westermani]|uniref:Exosome complex component MTR3 n=1 Tax=Paragonimus westermani TaxID=34504 RepID=A0A5J4N875_9TREM|nr:exosome complex component MTR3 [Paragonimus westermani]